MNATRAVGFGLVTLLLVRLLDMVVVPLTDPTEGRYAEIARKMVETGNWITPQFDYGVPFWAKPPLHSWLSAAGIAALGPTPFAARLGILLAAIATLVILWLWARTVTDKTLAAAAVLLTASSALFYAASAFVMTDMVLTLGVTAAMAGFYNGMLGQRRWGYLFFAGIAIGLLAKGPVATVLTMMPITAFMVWRGGWGDLRRLPWLGGTAMVLVLVVPWYVAAEIATPGFLHYFIIGEHIQRFLQPGWKGDLYGAGRRHPHGTIWLYWLLATLPWSPMLPILAWRMKKSWPLHGDKGLMLYLLFFMLSPLILFTVAANILWAYVLPGIPAAGLLAILLWTKSGAPQPRWLALGTAEMAVAFLIVAGVAAYGTGRLALPSDERLVAAFPGSGRLGIVGDRSFSAEFYTQGKIKRLGTADDIEAWMTPNDGVMILKSDYDRLRDKLANLSAVAEDKNHLLLMEGPALATAKPPAR